MSPNPNRAKGGKARAEALSPEDRKRIASIAAQTRWATPKADFIGDLEIGDLKIPCAVLPDGARVLSQRGVGRALGRSFGGSDWKRQSSGAGKLPFFMSAKGLKPFISNELLVLVNEPVMYRHEQGGGAAHGVPATALPMICDVWLKARDAGQLSGKSLEVAQRAEILIRGLAHVGIIALVDEATGYQDARARNALAKILEAFIDKELQPWTKTFPESFYKQIFRLRGWNYEDLAEGEKPRRPGVLGKYTVDLVYERLAPGVYEELKRVNPKGETGRRKTHHHRWFTTDLGHPKLSAHIEAITALAKVSPDWKQFKALVDTAYPKPGQTIPLDM
jgi:hypothetical protein